MSQNRAIFFEIAHKDFLSQNDLFILVDPNVVAILAKQTVRFHIKKKGKNKKKMNE